MTRLALAERRWLCDELASRGLAATSVIVANDENLEIAREFGFETVELGNDDVGEKFNAGYRHAASLGADVFVHIGSDDWVHPDAFDLLGTFDMDRFTFDEDDPCAVWSDGPMIVAQRRLTLIDLTRGVGRRLQVSNAYGCIPWILPRSLLLPHDFAPIGRGYMRGIDGALVRGLRGSQPNWHFQDAPAQWCVDFKTENNITSYRAIADSLGMTKEDEDPFLILRGHYPKWLIRRAQAFWAA